MIPEDKRTLVKTFREKITNAGLMHRSFSAVQKSILAAHQLNRLDNTGDILCVSGLAQTGKTYLARWFQSEFNGAETYSEHEVAYCQIKGQATLDHVAAELLDSLGDVAHGYGTPKAIDFRVKLALRGDRTRIVFMDDSHRMVDAALGSEGPVFADWFTRLADQCHIVFVFLGKPGVENLLKLNESLRARAKSPLSLNPFSEQRFGEFQSALRGLMTDTGLTNGIDVASEDIGLRLLDVSGGCIGLVVKLLSTAGTLALSQGLPGIELPHLMKAFAVEMSDDSTQANPFSPDAPRRKLRSSNNATGITNRLGRSPTPQTPIREMLKK